jgi:hypothetical protein
MGKRLIFVLVVALALSFSVAAYAETQNLKVSGDLLMRAVDRSAFTLNKAGKYEVSGLITDTRVRVDADLTDNVAITVRLLNERAWGQSWASDTIYGVTLGTSEVSDDINIDLAYVTLKEFLYSPLTMVVGRQDLRYGNALIIGNPGTDEWEVPADLSVKRSFDAIKGILNYDPLVVDVFFAKVNENDLWYAATILPEDNDVNLYGVNAKYDMSGLGITGTTDLYYFSRINRSTSYTATIEDEDTVHTMGFLVSGQIRENLTGSIEYARQFGNVASDVIGANAGVNLDRSAWALQAAANLALSKRWSPNLGLMFTILSGDRRDNGKYTFWNPMFEDQVPNDIVNAILPFTNCVAINAKASIQPAEDVKITGIYGYYQLAKEMSRNNGIPSIYGNAGFYTTSDEKDLGHALDLIGTYDYTEDVQLGLAFGYFDPGDAFNKGDGYKQSATQLIGSMKVTF